MYKGAGRQTPAARQALAETQPRNSLPRAQHQIPGHSTASSDRIPHHVSLNPEANLSVRQRARAQELQIERKLASPVAEEQGESSKRDSQVSNASTISVTKTKRKTHVGPWQLGKTLGKGATGRVRKAKHAVTGEVAAVKIVSKKSAAMVQSASMAKMDRDDTNIEGGRTMPFGIEREVVIMKLIEHPHVTNLYDIWENRGELYLVLEYIKGGELFDYVSSSGGLPEAEAVRLFRQIIAGLSCLHRFNICHRDLKPENILLDEDRNIKLADFGMAALQPANKWLNTSCGSPHYAAPEIIQGLQYRGDKADIWSVGIILFAMLNGFLPFDGEDLGDTLRMVKKGEYYLSPDLSPEAQDLITRMLQKRPERRITMADIWKHPLIRKWETFHANLVAPQPLVGPPAPLTAADCGEKIRPPDIDPEILRNLQTLWHGEKKHELIQRLSNDEANHEKVFYWALVKFREEQLENYPGETLQYSGSDYHHVKKPFPPPPSKSLNHTRRPSQFSIVSDEAGKRDSYYRNSAAATSKTTQGSYDPYRASRTPLVQSRHAGTVIVRHNHSVRRSRNESDAASYQMHTALTKQKEPPVPTIDPAHLERLITQQCTSYSTNTSRSSLASSRRTRPHKSNSYKRHVSFPHHRHASRSAKRHCSGTELRCASYGAEISRPTTQDSNQPFSDGQSTPSMPISPSVTQSRNAASELNLPKPRVASYYWKDETRKVSAELGKICEEAFNRYSDASTSEPSRRPVTNSSTASTGTTSITLSSGNRNRPLPLTPILQELLQRRQKIIGTWGDADPSTLTDIIATLDRHIDEERKEHFELRSASEPMHRGVQRNIHFMQQANPTDKFAYRDETHRSASDPTRDGKTVRLVTPEPSSPLALEVQRSKAMPVNSLRGPSQCSQVVQRNHYENIKRTYQSIGLDTIDEHPGSSGKRASGEPNLNRKWSWLGKMVAAGAQDGQSPSPPCIGAAASSDISTAQSTSDASASTKVETREIEAVVATKQKWFRKVFGRGQKKVVRPDITEHEVVNDDSDDTETTEADTKKIDSRRGPATGAYPAVTSVEAAAAADALKPPEISQNWFAKFFHIKPASRVLVLQLSKVKARKELVRTLREWRKYGLKDISVERRPSGDTVRGRVDAANYLHIKPVDFYAHLYAVVERGLKTNLSLMKFTQEKGAASSFYRVVDTLESVMQENNFLVTDKQRKRNILKSLKDAGL